MFQDSTDLQRGIAFATWTKGQMASRGARKALEQLAATGANWVAIIVTGYQDTVSSQRIAPNPLRTPSDDDLATIIEYARKLKLRVMLKPHVDLLNDPGHWRGEIGSTFRSDEAFERWFVSYEVFVCHYAQLAQRVGVGQFCVGTELSSTTNRVHEWQRIIGAVRREFDGPLVYASNHGGEEARITWWPLLDYIGVDAYYPLTDEWDPSHSASAASWTERGYVQLLADLAERHRKQIIVTEIGYRSVAGASAQPSAWGNSAAVDVDEQARCYEAAFEALWSQPWLAGLYWWVWEADPEIGGLDDTNYTPFGKPAERVVARFYRGAF